MIALGADHGGYAIKEAVKAYLQREGIPYKDFGTNSEESVDYAIYAARVVIHQGTYRECVRPQAGGEGPEKMVLYEAAGDGDVVIKASEEVTEFEKSTGWIMGEIEGE